jgi:hypothetical protein
VKLPRDAEQWWNSDPWCEEYRDLYLVRYIRGAWLRLYTFGPAVLVDAGVV